MARGIVSYSHSVAAAEQLGRLGADVTIDVIPQPDHGIYRQAVDRLIAVLKQDWGQSTGT